jgi:hypothetical protein
MLYWLIKIEKINDLYMFPIKYDLRLIKYKKNEIK